MEDVKIDARDLKAQLDCASELGRQANWSGAECLVAAAVIVAGANIREAILRHVRGCGVSDYEACVDDYTRLESLARELVAAIRQTKVMEWPLIAKQLSALEDYLKLTRRAEEGK